MLLHCKEVLEMRKKLGIIFMIIGLAAVLASVGLLIYNRGEDRRAKENAETVMPQIHYIISQGSPEATLSPEESPAAVQQPQTVPEMSEVIIGGHAYIGYLYLPTLDRELPVMSEMSYAKLNLAPCRQQGTVMGGDLVISAHNYDYHFGSLDKLKAGDSLSFTDMDGIRYNYTVEELLTVKPTEVDAVMESGYDMVLYTCTYGGGSRIAVFCQLGQ